MGIFTIQGSGSCGPLGSNIVDRKTMLINPDLSFWGIDDIRSTIPDRVIHIAAAGDPLDPGSFNPATHPILDRSIVIWIAI